MHREVLRWYLSPNPDGREKRMSHGPVITVPDFRCIENGQGDYVLWLGHATVYGRLGGVHFMTDPLFGGIMGRFGRRTPSPVRPRDLPGLDIVLVSHNHIDHLDAPSLRALQLQFNPLVVAGLGHRRLMTRLGFTRAVELDWWEERHLAGLEVFCVPVQHWSRRGIGDCDRALWCGYEIGSNDRKLLFVGDSGYYRGFAELGLKRGPYDLVILPVGAYRPRRLMAPQHMNPMEAYQAATDLRGASLLPIHWGTFGLGGEPLDAAPKELVKAASRVTHAMTSSGISGPQLEILNPGEALSLQELGTISYTQR